jgi:hypothetical protein
MKNIKRIAEEIFKAPSQSDLFERYFEQFEKNPDGSYNSNDIQTTVRIEPEYVKNGKMIVKWKKVVGSFTCYECGLISLEGCPEEVGGYFDCSKNKLISLKGAPKQVDKNFWCYDNIKQFSSEDILAVCKVKGEIYSSVPKIYWQSAK